MRKKVIKIKRVSVGFAHIVKFKIFLILTEIKLTGGEFSRITYLNLIHLQKPFRINHN